MMTDYCNDELLQKQNTEIIELYYDRLNIIIIDHYDDVMLRR